MLRSKAIRDIEMSLVANWLRNNRWKHLASLLSVETERMPKSGRAKLLYSSQMVLSLYGVRRELLYHACINPRETPEAICANFAYCIEDETAKLQELASRRGVKTNSYTEDSGVAEALFYYVRAGQIWTATLAIGVLPTVARDLSYVWNMLYQQTPDFHVAASHLEGYFKRLFGLPSLQFDLLHSGTLESFEAGEIPRPRPV